MDAELFRQARSLFGEDTIRRLQDVQAHTVSDAPAAAETTKEDIGAPDRRQNSGEPKAEGAPPKAEGAPDDAPATTIRLSARQQSRLWRHVESIEGFWESLNEIEPGIVARLGALAAERRWEIIFLTKRPEGAGATSQVQSQRWLESKGFTLPSVYVVQGSRGRIAASLGLDFVIDDRPENCVDVVSDSRARAILIFRSDERLLPPTTRRLGIGVVQSVRECLDILTQVDSPKQERPGVVDRVMRLFGLKESAKGPTSESPKAAPAPPSRSRTPTPR